MHTSALTHVELMARTGRELMVAWLQDEMRQATTADLQRAASLLQFAREVRKGCKQQRISARRAQASGWRKYVDAPLNW